MGFPADQSEASLVAAKGNVEQAIALLLSNPPEPAQEPEQPVEEPVEAPVEQPTEEPVEEPVEEPESPAAAWEGEWDMLLTELEEMGFEDHETNRELIAANSGNVKETVKELIRLERMNRSQ